MAGAIIENMSGRKLGVIGSVLIICQIACFLIGALVSPNPNNSIQVLATKCYDKKAGGDRETWFYPRGKGACKNFESFTDDAVKDMTADNVVFSFQLPLPRERIQLDYSRWQQNLIGILMFDIEYEDDVEHVPRVLLMLDARLGYRNKGDPEGEWKEYAKSFVTRDLDCEIDDDKKEVGQFYNCSILPLFDLGSLHHDYYLLNVRVPSIFNNEGQVIDINDKLGNLVDMWLVAINQNGGFTKVWVSLKTVFLPIILVELVWFWKRIKQLAREPTLLERMLLMLGCALSFLNIPLEYLTLGFDMPWLNLFNDMKQGLFYAMLMIFWLVFTGEHMINESSDAGQKNGLLDYWKKLSVVMFGCLCLFIFDMCERGVQLQNPFYSIWVTDLGKNLALGFIIMAGVSAGMYFLFLCYMIYKVFSTINEKQAAISAMSQVRRLHYQGIIWRFKFLMLATLVTAMFTVISFILGQVSEGQYKWDEDISLEYTAGFMTGVYGMWNVYIFGLIFLYAPSHKQWGDQSATDQVIPRNGEEIEFTVQSGVSPTGPSELSSLTDFISHHAAD